MRPEPEERNLNTADLAGAGEIRRPNLLESTESKPDRSVANATDLKSRVAGSPESHSEPAVPLVSDPEAESFRSKWNEIQVSFVDEPRAAVERADHLVAETMQQLASNFASERNKLESQWDRGDEVSTEDLRVALQRYRSYFQRLLAA